MTYDEVCQQLEKYFGPLKPNEFDPKPPIPLPRSTHLMGVSVAELISILRSAGMEITKIPDPVLTSRQESILRDIVNNGPYPRVLPRLGGMSWVERVGYLDREAAKDGARLAELGLATLLPPAATGALRATQEGTDWVRRNRK